MFRTGFVVPNANALRWFPGHMMTGLKQMQAKLRCTDLIIEVHDARIPLSGRNPNFKHTVLGAKPHILVLNKMDLCDMSYSDNIINYLKGRQNVSNIVYTNCRDGKYDEGIQNLVPLIEKVIKDSKRYIRSDSEEYSVMIIGVPNVGKSSLINTLRINFLKKKGVAQVGAKAGITRAVHNKIKISNSPSIVMFDTPGILTPTIPNLEVGMKLALCATLQDELIGPVTVADYLLYWLNKVRNFCYIDFFAVKEPCDNISYLLATMAIARNHYNKYRRSDGTIELKPNLVLSAQSFLSAFRRGEFGSFLLDIDVEDLMRRDKSVLNRIKKENLCNV